MTGTVRIKVCGVVHADDAAAAVDAGADLIGLNFVPGSPRALSLSQAEAIAERVAGPVERVAVFRDARWDEVERVTRRIEIERIQFHGDEPEEEVELMDLPVIKALRGADRDAAEAYPGAILLLDHPEGGGRGQRERGHPRRGAQVVVNDLGVELDGSGGGSGGSGGGGGSNGPGGSGGSGGAGRAAGAAMICVNQASSGPDVPSTRARRSTSCTCCRCRRGRGRSVPCPAAGAGRSPPRPAAPSRPGRGARRAPPGPARRPRAPAGGAPRGAADAQM